MEKREYKRFFKYVIEDEELHDDLSANDVSQMMSVCDPSVQHTDANSMQDAGSRLGDHQDKQQIGKSLESTVIHLEN